MFRKSTASLALGALVATAAQAQNAELPDGAGKDLVASLCTACHRSDQISRSSDYTREGWQELIATMVDLSANPAQRDTILAYLATHFAPHDRRAPTLVAGDVQVSFKQ